MFEKLLTEIACMAGYRTKSVSGIVAFSQLELHILV